MGYGIRERLPCSVCGVDELRRDGWYLVVEKRWLDRLRILTWDAPLASRRGVKSACGKRHLKVLLAHWLEQASLRLIPHTEGPLPVESDARRGDAFCPLPAARLLGELSVFREGFSREWTGSPETLEAIVDALLLPTQPDGHGTGDLPLFRPPHEPHQGLPLY